MILITETKMDNPRINWKIGETIRNKETAHPYLVIHPSQHFVSVVDLIDPSPILPTLTILPRNYADYARDNQMDSHERSGFRIDFTFNPLIA